MDEFEFQKLLDKLFHLSPLEKNNLYHFIVNTLKENQQRDAAGLIVAQFGELLANKRLEIEEKAADKQEGKVSPIFRRVT
ncbi:MAG TPA: hypothetical protein VM577_09140 [Anaerovoracaceae bacterium]|nr:hypothetical protein [Anaerovoracaceae bacterium]